MKEKIARLRRIIASHDSAAIAFSGGVDSSVLAFVAYEILGNRAIAVTVDSPMVPPRHVMQAVEVMESRNMGHHVIVLDLLASERVRSNPADRCYHCKKKIFESIKGFALEHGIETVLEGSNADDIHDYRPGMQALKELGIESPLMEAGLTKHEIRVMARGLGLDNWDSPPSPCLATRIPQGTPLTAAALKQVDSAEEILHNMGIRELRVRAHGTIARIEVRRDDMPFFIDEKNSRHISAELKKLGFQHIAVDIDGYRIGSMNKKIEENQD